MKFKPLLNPTQLTCQLTIGDWPAAKGVQKLIGFGRGLAFHRVDYFPYWHRSNSIVLGYNRSENEETVRLWAYGYADGKHFQEFLGSVEVGERIKPLLTWNEAYCSINLEIDRYSFMNYERRVATGFKTLPIGVLLRPYAEIDGKENKRTPFNVDIKNLMVNGKIVKI